MAGLRNIFTAGANVVRRVVGEPITYKRGLATVAITAVTAANAFEIVESDGQIVTWHGRDFWIHADDLVLNNNAIKPQRGDIIIDMDGRMFEVNAPANRPLFEHITDSAEFLIHTKEIS